MSQWRPWRHGLYWLAAHRERVRRRPGLVVLAVALLLMSGGGAIVGIALASQQHAPQPGPAQAGTIGPASSASATPPGDTGRGAQPTAPQQQRSSSSGTIPGLAASPPISVTIPAIGVHSQLLHLGLNPDGTIAVPPLTAVPSQAAWFTGSPTPGQIGTSVIEGHVDSYQGPAVFFRLGNLKPGDTADVTLADGTVAVFRVTGVRAYAKDNFPTLAVYEDTAYPSLRLITCGGDFDHATGHYLANTVVFASLIASHGQT